MIEQYRTFLMENWMGAVIGLTVWLVLSKARPDWVRAWNAKSGRHGWLMALLALALFGGATILAWQEGSRYLAVAMGAFTLYAVAMWIRRGRQDFPMNAATPQR